MQHQDGSAASATSNAASVGALIGTGIMLYLCCTRPGRRHLHHIEHWIDESAEEATRLSGSVRRGLDVAASLAETLFSALESDASRRISGAMRGRRDGREPGPFGQRQAHSAGGRPEGAVSQF